MTMTETANYRVCKTTTIGFVDPHVTTTTVWQGSDTDTLSRQYPPSDILFADPLGIQADIEDGYIRNSFRFERQAEDGSWEKCSDPRRRITPVTEYERAIDEENRRLFPGDYYEDGDAVPSFSSFEPADEGEFVDIEELECNDEGTGIFDANGDEDFGWCYTHGDISCMCQAAKKEGCTYAYHS